MNSVPLLFQTDILSLRELFKHISANWRMKPFGLAQFFMCRYLTETLQPHNKEVLFFGLLNYKFYLPKTTNIKAECKNAVEL